MYSKFLLFFSCVLSISSMAQKFATSPFSSYGIGDINALENASFSGFGNAATGVSDSLNVNYFNPASYSFLGQGQALFSTGISTRISTYSENGLESKNNFTGINHFAFGLSFAKRFGFAFGLKPFSRVGYSISDSQAFGTDTVNYTYSGDGGFNDVFTGFSAKLLDLKSHKISLGANVSYLFGNTINTRTANLSSLASGSIERSNYQIKSLNYEFGFNYHFIPSSNSKFVLGVSYSPQQDFSTLKDLNLNFAYDVTNTNSIADTIYSSHENGLITMPSKLNIGFSYSFRPKVDSSFNKTKIFQLSLFGSYSSVNWDSYKTNFANEGTYSFLNTTRMSFGFEFIPHYNYLDRTKNISYLSRIRYRAGIQYATLPIERASKQLTDSGITFGLSLPIVSQRSVSSLNIGVTTGKRGNGEIESLNEKYIGINFGITIAPGTSDRWFRKYKID